VILLLALGCFEYDVTVRDRTDVFLQDPAQQVDILIVVDNSASMLPYQERLALHFDDFIRFFREASTDYHIGVTSTTTGTPLPPGTYGCQVPEWGMPEDGALAGPLIIANGTPNAEERFAQLVQVGTCGAGAEMGMESSRLALEERMADGTNGGFLRPDAALSIVYVSDEQDSSPRAVSEYMRAFQDTKDASVGRNAFVASAVVVLDEEHIGCDDPDFPPTMGTRYDEAARLTGGVSGNICNADFTEIISELSLASSRLSERFALSELPDPRTLEVVFDEEEPLNCADGTWTYELVENDDGSREAAIVFDRDHLPPPSTTVSVSYVYGTGDPELFCQNQDTGA
jgi:hypothetical protein